jgi:hypothetical protein
MKVVIVATAEGVLREDGVRGVQSKKGRCGKRASRSKYRHGGANLGFYAGVKRQAGRAQTNDITLTLRLIQQLPHYA